MNNHSSSRYYINGRSNKKDLLGLFPGTLVIGGNPIISDGSFLNYQIWELLHPLSSWKQNLPGDLRRRYARGGRSTSRSGRTGEICDSGDLVSLTCRKNGWFGHVNKENPPKGQSKTAGCKALICVGSKVSTCLPGTKYIGFLSHRMHVWYIYLRLVHFGFKCR